MTDTNCDLDKQYQHFFPLFERYILDFQKHVDHVAPPTQTRATLKSNTTALVPANWSWETYNPCNPQYYNFTKVCLRTCRIYCKWLGPQYTGILLG